MKWAHFDTVDASERLLYWVLMYVLSPYFDDLIDHWLKKILGQDGGVGGDPGWEIERVSDGTCNCRFLVWADPNMSGIDPLAATYSKEAVMHAIRNSLLALVETQPEREHEVKETLKRYALDH